LNTAHDFPVDTSVRSRTRLVSVHKYGGGIPEQEQKRLAVRDLRRSAGPTSLAAILKQYTNRI
jgi:hypothetical protein